MRNGLPRHAAALAAALSLMALAGCGSVNLWPFGESETPEASRKPSNATEYRCDGGKVFYVRGLDASSVWLIAPDREIRLDKQGEGRWGVGRVLLETSGEGAVLTDPPAQFANCKRAG